MEKYYVYSDSFGKVVVQPEDGLPVTGTYFNTRGEAEQVCALYNEHYGHAPYYVGEL
mgnify:CR=1 FL=1